MTDLEGAVRLAAENATEAALQAVGAAWVRLQAEKLIETERLRRRQAALVAEARGRVAELRQAAEQAHGEMRRAVEEHEAALLAQRIFLNRGAVVREGATAATDERRGELAGNVARTQATRQRLADVYRAAQAAEAAAVAELARLEGA